MTREKGHKGSQSWGRTSSQQTPDAATLSQQINQHLQISESAISDLKDELVAYREQNQNLTKERNDLLKLLSQSKLIQTERTESEAKWHSIRGEHDRMMHTLRIVRQEYEDLKKQHAVLQTALAQKQDQAIEAQDVIVCLEEQVEQLQATVDLLFLHLEMFRSQQTK
jgi:chromosome segregation ATPase